MLRRLLLLPLLSPLLAVLLVGAVNPRPALSLRLLTWRSPSLPLGLWIALAGAGGAAVSAGATAVALRQGGGASFRPMERRGSDTGAAVGSTGGWVDGVPGSGGRERDSRRASTAATDQDTPARWEVPVGPPRAPGAPAPTVSVPFRVLRRGGGGPSGATGTAGGAWGFTRGEASQERDRPAEAGTAAARGPATAQAGAARSVPAGEDWDSPESEEW